MLCYLTALITSCGGIYFPAVLCVLTFVLGGLFCFISQAVSTAFWIQALRDTAWVCNITKGA